MTRYYLSGPISNADPAIVARNKAAFMDAESSILHIEAGARVMNPVRLCAHIEAGGLAGDELWGACMRRCLVVLAGCDAIVLLPGYERSRGAMLELYIAGQLGMPVHTLAGLLESAS